MPPCTSVAVRTTDVAISAEVRLGEQRHPRRLLGPLIEGVRGVPDQRARRLDLGGHLGAQVLHRLERADRAAELLALLRVGDRHLERAIARAEQVGRERDARRVERRERDAGRLDPGRRAARRRSRARRRAACGRSSVSARRRDPRHPRGTSASDRGRAATRKRVRAPRVEREERRAVQAIALQRARRRRRASRQRLARPRRRAARRPAAMRGSHSRLLRGRSRPRSATRRHHGRREERARAPQRRPSDSATSAASSKREPAAAVRLGHEHARDAELGERPPTAWRRGRARRP